MDQGSISSFCCFLPVHCTALSPSTQLVCLQNSAPAIYACCTTVLRCSLRTLPLLFVELCRLPSLLYSPAAMYFIYSFHRPVHILLDTPHVILWDLRWFRSPYISLYIAHTCLPFTRIRSRLRSLYLLPRSVNCLIIPRCIGIFHITSKTRQGKWAGRKRRRLEQN